MPGQDATQTSRVDRERGRRRARIARLIDRARTRWTPRGSRRMGRRRRASWWFTRSARGSADLILQLSIIREASSRPHSTIQRARDPEQHVREARIRPGGHAMRHLLGHPQEGQGGLPVPPPLLPGMHRGAPPQAVSPVPITRRICPTTAPLPPPPHRVSSIASTDPNPPIHHPRTTTTVIITAPRAGCTSRPAAPSATTQDSTRSSPRSTNTRRITTSRRTRTARPSRR